MSMELENKIINLRADLAAEQAAHAETMKLLEDKKLHHRLACQQCEQAEAQLSAANASLNIKAGQIIQLWHERDAARAQVERLRGEMKKIYLLLCDERIVDRSHLMGELAKARLEHAKQICGDYYMAGQALADAPPPAAHRPRIVCLCGSTRFMEAFQQANLNETLAGRIVLSIGCNTKSDLEVFVGKTANELIELKSNLDALHKRKIDLCDEVLVLNVGGYIGDSTRSELEYAKTHDKPVRYLSDLPVPKCVNMGNPTDCACQDCRDYAHRNDAPPPAAKVSR